jgi:hypothetical protein
MDFNFAKDRYDCELRRKEQLTAALTSPVAILSILGGGVVIMALSFSYSDQRLTNVFAPVLAADACAISVCLLFLARAYRPQRYLYLPLLKDLLKWEREYAEHARYFQQDGARCEGALLERMIEAADRATTNNDNRCELLYRVRVALFTVLCLSVIAAIPYVIDRVRH